VNRLLLLLLLLAFLWILKTIPNAQTQTEERESERERGTHVHTRTLYILKRAMASALGVPATTVATVGRSKALLIDVCRRSRPRLVESSIRARRASSSSSSSSCGNWLPHRFLVASPPLGGRRRSTAAAAAQWRGLRRPAGLSMLSLHSSSTGWLLLPPPSYAVERGSFSRSTSTQAVIAAPPPPKTGANPELVKELGFEVLEERFIYEYKSTATLYRHNKTGAEIMSVTNDDENKVFGIVFRTPPKDSTGIPHILEHSVLCGSRKYPLKEPFVELLKGSLHTFLNAFTYPDRTCYPVASTNLKDFYNLVDVYLDAVFHPRCVNEVQTFQQEGWHYELNDPSEDITYKGVVFNEMKGVYSQPDNVLGRVSQQASFPDNTYGVDSGGDPTVIPNLTFQQFQEFHAKFYHPSNARVWFYGDDDPDERLHIISAYLAEFEANAAAKESEVTIQKLFSEPKRVVEKYAVGDGGDLKKKHMVCLNWVLSDTPLDPETELALGFLDHLMLGTPGSPLTKVLLESGLGEAIVGGGIEDELRQPQFSIGLKGVAADDVSRVEDLVFSTLKQLIEDGFSSEAVEASMNTIEFSLRENNTGSFPRGLSLMLRSMVSGESEFERTRWCLEVFFSETVTCCVHFFPPGLVSPLSSDHFSD
jgi:predicted Zn-dependent peptidase